MTGEFKLYPNPVKNGSILKYELKKTGEVYIEIQDINGSKISKLFSGIKPAGKHELLFNPSIINHLNGKNGPFLVIIKTGSEQKIIKFIH
jgi:hypothetical protein